VHLFHRQFIKAKTFRHFHQFVYYNFICAH